MRSLIIAALIISLPCGALADGFILAPAVQFEADNTSAEWTNPNAYDTFITPRYGFIIEDFLITPALSCPSFAVYFLPLSNNTLWELGISYYIPLGDFRLLAGIHGGLYFLEDPVDDIYFPAIVTMGAAYTYGPAIIQLAVKITYLQEEHAWAKVFQEGYNISWTPVVAVGLRL